MTDYDLNGNRFYQEYIIERGERPTGEITKVAAAVSAGCRIAEGVAAMPLVHGDLSTSSDGLLVKKPDAESALARLFNFAPNNYMTGVEFVEHITLKACFEGAGRAYVNRSARGKVRALIPCDLKPQKDSVSGKVTYSGTVDGVGQVSVERKNVLEITAPRFSQISGLNVKQDLKAVFSLAIAQEKQSVENATVKSIKHIISFPGALNEKKALDALEALKDKLPGAVILDGGAGSQQLAPTAAENQLLQSRRHTIEEVARAFGIHPLLLAHDAAGQSLTRIDDVMRYHLRITLAPWVKRWEHALGFCFGKPGEYITLDESEFWRMSPEDRSKQAAQSLGAGGNKPWSTQNEARSLFGLNPLDEGSVLHSDDNDLGEFISE